MKAMTNDHTEAKDYRTLKPYTVWACVFSGISVFVFWFLGFVGVVLGVRALQLTWREANRGREGLIGYRFAAFAAIIVGLISIGFGISMQIGS